MLWILGWLVATPLVLLLVIYPLAIPTLLRHYDHYVAALRYPFLWPVYLILCLSALDLLFLWAFRETTTILTEIGLLILSWQVVRLFVDPKPSLNNLPNMSGKLVLLTGCAGIGYEAAKVLAMKGADVVIAARDENKGTAAANSINRSCGKTRAVFIQLNLDSLANVEPFIANLEMQFPGRLVDILYANAGFCPLSFSKQKEGFENAFGTMHLAHFSLFQSLVGSLLAPNARVVITASESHRYLSKSEQLWWDLKEQTEPAASGVMLYYYARAKLCNILFAKQMAVEHPNIRVNAIHPGGVYTGIWQYPTYIPSYPKEIFEFWTWMIMKTPQEGCNELVYLATTSDTVKNGSFLMMCRDVYSNYVVSPLCFDDNLAKDLWNKSKELIANFKNGKKTN